MKGVKVAACGIKCIDLTKDAINMLGIFFSYNQNIELEQNFKKPIVGIKKVLRMWHWRNLILEDKIINFKALASSKLALLI